MEVAPEVHGQRTSWTAHLATGGARAVGSNDQMLVSFIGYCELNDEQLLIYEST